MEGALSIVFSMTSQMAKDPLTLDVAIVGCGISGLAAAYALGKAGHHITIIESSPLLADVGAGIQVSPSKPSVSLQLDDLHSVPVDVSRILIKWGLGDRLEKLAVQPKGIFFRRCELLSDPDAVLPPKDTQMRTMKSLE